ncbi:hypothetical protein E4U09_004382 [Claviceps aff. purpurea]|uniref:Uncharacterized protein n=1 Tax=Claviceps aff. purpurea TaxID=1967640 RepID=A0A9P7U1E3_9HYPO|nr:hypothetical protein E4U09_004382 [Claviceps aff. purpurea]
MLVDPEKLHLRGQRHHLRLSNVDKIPSAQAQRQARPRRPIPLNIWLLNSDLDPVLGIARP